MCTNSITWLFPNSCSIRPNSKSGGNKKGQHTLLGVKMYSGQKGNLCVVMNWDEERTKEHPKRLFAKMRKDNFYKKGERIREKMFCS